MSKFKSKKSKRRSTFRDGERSVPLAPPSLMKSVSRFVVGIDRNLWVVKGTRFLLEIKASKNGTPLPEG